tara:strand:+ start:185 stop:553 length:369 start_codon:yes stop_codon:yes gene_type:complete
MKYTILEALKELKPEAIWTLNGNNYSDLNWQDSGKTKPTEAEINAKISELDAAEPMRLLRKERNSLLNKTDWTQNDDVPTETQTKWQTYRQQLRDLPATASPTLDSDYNLNLSSVNWPTEPS